VMQEAFLIVESVNTQHSENMRNHPDSSSPRQMWQAMLASLRTCFSCGVSLHTASVDGFCRDCFQRSRDVTDEQLGGEA